MCITSLKAELESTHIGVWDIQHPKYGYRHVLAYQNAPRNKRRNPNCMLLHIPAKSPILPEHIVDTSDCPDLLKNMRRSIDRYTRGRAQEQNYILQMGIYHIAILNDLSRKETVLEQIPKKKRPQIDQKFFDFFETHFPNYPLLLCCFSNHKIAEASPIMVHFDPIRPDYFVFPNLDAHGKIPNIGEKVMCKRLFVYGRHDVKKPISERVIDIQYRDTPERLLPFLPKYGDAERLNGDFPNTDIIIKIADINSKKGVRPHFDLLPRFLQKNP